MHALDRCDAVLSGSRGAAPPVFHRRLPVPPGLGQGSHQAHEAQGPATRENCRQNEENESLEVGERLL